MCIRDSCPRSRLAAFCGQHPLHHVLVRAVCSHGDEGRSQEGLSLIHIYDHVGEFVKGAVDGAFVDGRLKRPLHPHLPALQAAVDEVGHCLLYTSESG